MFSWGRNCVSFSAYFFPNLCVSVFLVVQLSNLCVLYSNLGSSFFCGFSEILVLRIMSFDENTLQPSSLNTPVFDSQFVFIEKR